MKLMGTVFNRMVLVLGICSIAFTLPAQTNTTNNSTGQQDREYWVNTLYKIVNPVVKNMAAGTLKKNLPLEKGPGYSLSVTKSIFINENLYFIGI